MVWGLAGDVSARPAHAQPGVGPSPDQTFPLAGARGRDRRQDTQLVEDKCVNAATENTHAQATLGSAAAKHLNCPCSEPLPINANRAGRRKKKKKKKRNGKTTLFLPGQGKIRTSSYNDKVQPQERIKGQMHRMWWIRRWLNPGGMFR